MNLEAPPLSTTLSVTRADQLGQEFRRMDDRFLTEADRVKYADEYDEIKTIDDYIMVTAVADIIPEIELTVGHLFDARDREELLSAIFFEYFDNIELREIFQRMAVDDMNQRLEIPTASPDIAAPTDPDESFPTQDMEYETKTVDRTKYGGQTVIGSTRPQFISIQELCQNFVELIAEEVLEVVPNPRSGDKTGNDAVLEAIHEIESNMYRPDILIGGEDTLENEYITEMVEPGTEFDLYESDFLIDDEIIVASSDHFGYECVWSEPTIQLSSPLKYDTTDISFTPIEFRVSTAMNWMSVMEDAITRVQL